MFDRATRKFKGDPGIWMAWLKFCKDSQSKQQVSKVITKALKLHPTAPYFWAYAAAWCVSSLSRLRVVRCTTLCCMPANPGSWLYSGATLIAVASASRALSTRREHGSLQHGRRLPHDTSPPLSAVCAGSLKATPTQQQQGSYCRVVFGTARRTEACGSSTSVWYGFSASKEA